jgi:hypothetical protein
MEEIDLEEVQDRGLGRIERREHPRQRARATVRILRHEHSALLRNVVHDGPRLE